MAYEKKEYRMKESAKYHRQQYVETVIKTLRGENDTFMKNMNAVEGPLYNPITNHTFDGQKQLSILMQAHTINGGPITDQRFVTAKQAKSHGAYQMLGSKAVHVEKWIPMEKKTDGTIVLNGDTNPMFNGADVKGLLEEKRILTYTPEEKIKIMEHAVKLMNQSEKKRIEYAQKNGLPEPEFPDKNKSLSREMYYSEVLKNLSDYTAQSKGYNNDLKEISTNVKNGKTYTNGGEYLKIPGEKGRVVAESPDLARDRADFRAQLAGICLSQEIGCQTMGLVFKDPKTPERLAKAYEEHPEKYFHDAQAVDLITTHMKENILFKQLERERIPENELTQEQKEKIQKGNYKLAYRYRETNLVERKDVIINNSPHQDSEYEKKRLETAREKALTKVDNEISGIQSMRENTMIVSKDLIERIAKERESLGRESDPSKFTNGYTDVGKEVIINVDSTRIRNENMNHETIINTFANGKEQDDVISKVRETAQKTAVEKTRAQMHNEAIQRSKNRALEEERKKEAWKTKEIEKSKARTRPAKSITGRDLG